MSRRRRFDWGKAYLLTDLKGGVFVNEPAVCVGKHDSDRDRPTICAVCGEPLGATGYYSFHLSIPNGYGRDMMIGSGCIRDRIRGKEIDAHGYSPKETLEKISMDFPQSGRWYGTFLHHCIAKPYVRDKKAAEKWDESVLRLPGVRYIMKIIDDLRDDGWKLDAEMVLECGNVDLLASHDEKGTLVFDWKSDLSFDNHEAYIEQVCRYMTELNGAGMQKITGYIVWIRNQKLEHVPFKEIPLNKIARPYMPSSPIKCTLGIELNGGEGIRKKKMSEYSHHRIYGDEVSFFIPTDDLWKYGHDISYFEASPYREDERPQLFSKSDIEDGFHVSFICSKKRRSFTLTANWKRTRPFECTLSVFSNNHSSHFPFVIREQSKIDNDGNDYVEFDVSEINKELHDKVMTHAILSDYNTFAETGTEWGPDDLRSGMKIRIPCTNGQSRFAIVIETKGESKKTIETVKKTEPESVFSISNFRQRYESIVGDCILSDFMNGNHDNPSVAECRPVDVMPLPDFIKETDIAEYRFTPGRIYKSGSRYYGIYKRLDSDKFNTNGKVDVAAVDIQGKKISNLEWRYVYTTRGGKEYIYSPIDHKWKIYTDNVLVGLSPEGMDRFGK